VKISALTWVEENIRHTFKTQSELKGTPVLVVEQLNEDGSVFSGRVVVSEDLYAWDIDAAGHVHPRGQLIPNDAEPS